MRSFRVAAVAALLAGAGCGEPAAPPPPVAKQEPPTPRGFREMILPQDLEQQRAKRLRPRDTRLSVGAQAPTFDGFPAAARTVIVFFRGRW